MVSKTSIVFGVLILILILYLYFIQFYRIKCPRVFNDDLIDSGQLKTGDIIVFKAYDNFNAAVIGYFTHIGMVYIDPETKVPMLFESNGIEHTPLKEHHSRTGVYLTPLKDRIAKYKGQTFWKELNNSIPPEVEAGFGDFIQYALKEMSYDYAVIKSGLRKLFGEKCTKLTNCGETVFLSMLKLGLLDESKYDLNIMNHVRWCANTYELDNGYKYSDMIEVVEYPFAE